MKIASLFVLASLLLTTTFVSVKANAEANPTQCISQKDMSDIASHFSQFEKLGGKEFCNDGSENWHLLQSLMFMRSNQFAPDMKPSTDELFSGRFAASWYEYFIGRIDDMVIDTSCPKGVAAYVYAFGGKTMYVCSMALTDNFSSLDRASIFMHEARHIDGYPHMTCSRGPRAGLQGACDNRISAGGSYAVTVETYAQLAKFSKELHPALKAYSRSAAVIYADEAFETPVRITRAAQLLAITKDRKMWGVDLAQTKTVQPLGEAPVLGHIIMRSQHMVLLPEDRSQIARYVFANNVGEISQSPGDAFTRYNQKSPSDRANFVDMHIAAQWNAEVYKDQLVFTCDPKSPATSVQKVAGTEAVAVLYINGYDRVSRSHYLLAANGSILEFGCDQSLKSFLRPATISLDQSYKRIHKIGNVVVGLTADGRLFQINGTSSSPIVTAMDGEIYEIAPRESFGFFDTAAATEPVAGLN